MELTCTHRNADGKSALILGGFYFDWQCQLCGMTDMDTSQSAAGSLSIAGAGDLLASVDFTRKS